MNKNFSRLLPAALLLLVVTWYGCKKETPLTIAPEQAHFANQSSGSYFITAPGVTYKIPVGITNVSNSDRTIKVSVTSPTGAVEGTHYTLNKTSFVIPAGKAIDTLVVSGVYAQYLAGRKDTLIFKIEGADKGGVTAAEYNNTFTLFMRGPCFASDLTDVTVFELVGSYTDTRETTSSGGSPYGPYTTKVKSMVLTSPTTATVLFENLWDAGWNDIPATLDWTNPAAPKVTIARQDVGQDYAAGQPFQVRTSPTITSTFNYCTRTFNLVVDIIVNNYPVVGSAAFYSQNYRINMK
jgi:hypothetical protein